MTEVITYQLERIGNLEILLMSTESHLPELYNTYPEHLKQVADQIGRTNDYDLAILEGIDKDAPDAVLVSENIRAKQCENLFSDPLSVNSYKLFRERFSDVHELEVAARYAAAWLNYGEVDGYGMGGYEAELQKIFVEVYGGDGKLPLIGQEIQKLRERLKKSFNDNCLSDINLIIEIANDISERDITKRLTEFEGRVFFFCGSKHEIAVRNAYNNIKSDKEDL